MEANQSSVKKCSKCRRELPLTEFYNSKSMSDGKDCYCKDCRKLKQKEIYNHRLGRTNGGNPALADFTPRQLIEELRARGYTGKLQYIQEIKI